jgi:hypothetical protein
MADGVENMGRWTGEVRTQITHSGTFQGGPEPPDQNWKSSVAYRGDKEEGSVGLPIVHFSSFLQPQPPTVPNPGHLRARRTQFGLQGRCRDELCRGHGCHRLESLILGNLVLGERLGSVLMGSPSQHSMGGKRGGQGKDGEM